MTTRAERQIERRHATLYRMLRVELTELRDELAARDSRPAGRHMDPKPLLDRVERMLNRRTDDR